MVTADLQVIQEQLLALAVGLFAIAVILVCILIAIIRRR